MSIQPHGGRLIDRRLRGDERLAALDRAKGLKQIVLDSAQISDVELLGNGAFSPLTGFMKREDYLSVVESMRLPGGGVWSLPITLPVSADLAAEIEEGGEVALVEEGGRILALLRVEEKFTYDKRAEAQQVYGTTELAHPGVARLMEQGDVLLGGEIQVVNDPSERPFPEFRHSPAETRRIFASRGWRRIVGFQTRNPIHRAHEYIQKCALEICDALFLHPLVGETKSDDIPADLRMRSYQSLLRDYYPPDRTLLAVFPATMRYAGPREAIFHALCRKNYGCTHFIVGRDHAGVGSYYGTYDAQKIFDNFKPDEIGITPLFFEHTFYCRRCGQIVSDKTCPHSKDDRLILSGTQVREMLQRGEAPPPEFTRPEVAAILIEGYRRRSEAMADALEASDRAKGGRSATKQPEGAGTSPTPGDATASQPQAGPVRHRKARKLFVIGLDCAPPELIFDRYRDELPALRRLMEEGAYGEMESCTPPITVPAWSSMTSSRDPGQLGFYGFRNRADHSYDRMTIATSKAVKADRVWDILSRAGKEVIVVGVPQTYPVSPVNGHLISCFLTPSTQSTYTYPASLKSEIEALVGEYMVDVPNFRTENKDWLLRQIYEMTEKRFRVVRYLMRKKPWDFFMFVEMGTDRIHHGFWKYMDPEHIKYEAGNRFEDAIRDYYRYIDREIAELLDLLDDDTVVMVVSDHGARRMDGGIAINEWLIQNGYLTLKEQPSELVPLEKVEIDWSKTKAWGAGGYYGRLFLNVRGREPQGVIDPSQVDAVKEELIARLEALTDESGSRPIGTRVFQPEKVYREINNVPPDLIVYFGNLYWRSVGSVGLGQVHTRENDTGPDDANHAQMGIFAFFDPRNPMGGRRLEGVQLVDFAPTALKVMGVDVPPEMIGKVVATE